MSAYHNAELGQAIEVSTIVLEDLTESDISRDKKRVGEGDVARNVFTLTINDAEYEYSTVQRGKKAKHDRNSDYYRIINAMNKAKEAAEKAAETEEVEEKVA